VKSLETALHYQPKLEQRGRRWLLDHPETAYLGATVLGTAGVTWAALSLARRFGARALGPLGYLALGPACELALQGVNYLVTKTLPPRALPKLNFEGGVPDQWRTIVVVPMLLSSAGSDSRRSRAT
jgi:cyclic beta-1,2-glucan synthetase